MLVCRVVSSCGSERPEKEMVKMATTAKVTYDLVRDSNNNIVRYIAINKGLVIGNIDKVDAIGLGVVFTYNTFVFDTLKSAKQFAQKVA